MVWRVWEQAILRTHRSGDVYLCVCMDGCMSMRCTSKLRAWLAGREEQDQSDHSCCRNMYIYACGSDQALSFSLCYIASGWLCLCSTHVCTHWESTFRLPTTYQGTWDNNNLDIVVWTRKIPWVPKSIWLNFSTALNDGRRIIPRIILQWIFTGCLTKTKRQHTVRSCFSCYIYS